MFVIFSPYSFLYMSSYLLFLFSLLQISSFYYYWSVMEIIILLFIGLSYSIIVRSYSHLIIYFLIQTVASFLILVFYIYDFSFFLTSSLILKLSMFPFFMWYINSVYRLPNFIFWLASTIHKIPPILIIKVFYLNLNSRILWVSIFFTTIVIGFIILSVYDLRILLVLSSIGNNSWLLIRQIVSYFIFVIYIIFYRFVLFYVLLSFGSLSKLQAPKRLTSQLTKFSFWLLTLSGIPPFPLFYLKVGLLVRLFFSVGLNHIFLLFIISRAFIFIAYLRSLIVHYVYFYSSSLFYLFKY